jgi:hypothetical protein
MKRPSSPDPRDVFALRPSLAAQTRPLGVAPWQPAPTESFSAWWAAASPVVLTLLFASSTSPSPAPPPTVLLDEIKLVPLPVPTPPPPADQSTTDEAPDEGAEWGYLKPKVPERLPDDGANHERDPLPVDGTDQAPAPRGQVPPDPEPSDIALTRPGEQTSTPDAPEGVVKARSITPPPGPAGQARRGAPPRAELSDGALVPDRVPGPVPSFRPGSGVTAPGAPGGGRITLGDGDGSDARATPSSSSTSTTTNLADQLRAVNSKLVSPRGASDGGTVSRIKGILVESWGRYRKTAGQAGWTVVDGNTSIKLVNGRQGVISLDLVGDDVRVRVGNLADGPHPCNSLEECLNTALQALGGQ